MTTRKWIKRGFVPLPLTIEDCDFYWHDRRLSLFVRILLKKGYQAEFILWEGRADFAVPPHSLRTSIRHLAKELKMSRTTLAEALEWFAQRGYIDVIKSQRSGIVIRILDTDAFRHLAATESGHQNDDSSHGNDTGNKIDPKNNRPKVGHHTGHLSGHFKTDLSWLKDASFSKPDPLCPATFAATYPATISLRSISFINLSEIRKKNNAGQKSADVGGDFFEPTPEVVAAAKARVAEFASKKGKPNEFDVL